MFDLRELWRLLLCYFPLLPQKNCSDLHLHLHVVVHYFLLDCLILCWSKLFILRCKKYIILVKIFGGGLLVFIYYRNVCKYVINSLSTNVMIHKVQGFINWFETYMIDQFGLLSTLVSNTFPSLQKGANWSIGI